MAKYDYNLMAIGAGAAGLVTSYIGAAVKAKVALVEKHKMGGDCLNTGCVPSKALIRSAKILSYANRLEDYGFKNTKVDFEFKDVMQRVHDIISKIEPHDSVERYTSLGVDCIKGNAKIKSKHSIEIDGKEYTTRSIVVATGAKPFIPNIKGVDKVDFLTSDNIWEINELPKTMVVLGGGPIGCELAQAFARLGCKVTIVQRGQKILPNEDKDVIELVSKKFASEGINVLTGHEAVELKENSVICDNNGEEVELEFDKILFAVGRKPNVSGFGLEELGIKIRENGSVDSNPFMQTNIPSIYVCGDVTGPYQYTHVAAHQAWYASVNSMFAPFKKFKVDYSVIPWATFTDPEVAKVGLNEKEAKEKNIDYEVAIYGIDDLDRAIADGEGSGFVKVLTVPKKDKILGVTIVASNAGDLISEYVLAMKYGIGLNKILGTIHIYPTMSEANKYAAGVWKQNHKPEFVLDLLRKFHKWRRG